MTRTAFGLLALLALLPVLSARDKAETPTPAQQYQALVKEFQTAGMEFRKALAAAKTRADVQKAIEEKSPRPDKFAPRFLELAENNPEDLAAVDALGWIISYASSKKSDLPNTKEKALKTLLRDHVQGEKIVRVCSRLRYAQSVESQQLMRAVLEKNTHRSAKALACVVLAQQAETRLSQARCLQERPNLAKQYEARWDKETVEALAKADLNKLSKEAETLYERIVKEFADVADPLGGTLGKMAERKLEELRHPILVGKPVPEIDGEDIDGKHFKLSDYRGKVVLLDFWGNW